MATYSDDFAAVLQGTALAGSSRNVKSRDPDLEKKLLALNDLGGKLAAAHTSLNFAQTDPMIPSLAKCLQSSHAGQSIATLNILPALFEYCCAYQPALMRVVLPHLLPALIDRLGDSKRLARERAIQVLAELWSALHALEGATQTSPSLGHPPRPGTPGLPTPFLSRLKTPSRGRMPGGAATTATGAPSLMAHFERDVKMKAFQHKVWRVKEQALTWLQHCSKTLPGFPTRRYISFSVKLLEDSNEAVRDGAKLVLSFLATQSTPETLDEICQEIQRKNIRPSLAEAVLGKQAMAGLIAPAKAGLMPAPHSLKPPLRSDGPAEIPRPKTSLGHFAGDQARGGGSDAGLASKTLRKVSDPHSGQVAAPADPRSEFTKTPAVPAVRIHSAKQLDQEVQAMLGAFQGKEGEDNWTQREKAIQTLRGMLAANALDYHQPFVAHLKVLMDGILKALHSLRTTLQLSTTHLIIDLAVTMRTRIDHYSDLLLQNLLKLCQLTKKLANQAGFQAAHVLISCTSYQSRLFQTLASFLGDKSVTLRESIIRLVKVLLEIHQFTDGGDRTADALGYVNKCLKLGLTDASPKTRDAAREVYWLYWHLHAASADALLGTMDGSVKKQVLRDQTKYTHFRHVGPVSQPGAANRHSAPSSPRARPASRNTERPPSAMGTKPNHTLALSSTSRLFASTSALGKRPKARPRDVPPSTPGHSSLGLTSTTPAPNPIRRVSHGHTPAPELQPTVPHSVHKSALVTPRRYSGSEAAPATVAAVDMRHAQRAPPLSVPQAQLFAPRATAQALPIEPASPKSPVSPLARASLSPTRTAPQAMASLPPVPTLPEPIGSAAAPPLQQPNLAAVCGGTQLIAPTSPEAPIGTPVTTMTSTDDVFQATLRDTPTASAANMTGYAPPCIAPAPPLVDSFHHLRLEHSSLQPAPSTGKPSTLDSNDAESAQQLANSPSLIPYQAAFDTTLSTPQRIQQGVYSVVTPRTDEKLGIASHGPILSMLTGPSDEMRPDRDSATWSVTSPTLSPQSLLASPLLKSNGDSDRDALEAIQQAAARMATDSVNATFFKTLKRHICLVQSWPLASTVAPNLSAKGDGLPAADTNVLEQLLAACVAFLANADRHPSHHEEALGVISAALKAKDRRLNEPIWACNNRVAALVFNQLLQCQVSPWAKISTTAESCLEILVHMLPPAQVEYLILDYLTSAESLEKPQRSGSLDTAPAVDATPNAGPRTAPTGSTETGNAPTLPLRYVCLANCLQLVGQFLTRLDWAAIERLLPELIPHTVQGINHKNSMVRRTSVEVFAALGVQASQAATSLDPPKADSTVSNPHITPSAVFDEYLQPLNDAQRHLVKLYMQNTPM
ncbi:suppressor of tub2 mutation [Dimargaris xerosporica]|nr:suppressor of tub2 mutation [Dimargaris xerosporica]